MRSVYVSLLVTGMCLMGCLGNEGSPSNQAAGPSEDDPAIFVVRAPHRELAGSELSAARYGLADAVTSAHLADIDVGGLTDRLAAGSKLKLALPGAGPAVLAIQTMEELLPGVTTFSGHLAGDETSDFTLSIEAGQLVGAIRQGPYAWLVKPDPSSNQHLIRMLDRTLLADAEPSLRRPPQDLSQAPGRVAAAQPPSMFLSNGNVRVLFLHASDVPNASAMAANIVSEFNASLSTSGVSATNYLSIAGVQWVGSSFSGMTREQIRDAMGARTAPFTGINSDIATTGADIVFLLVRVDPTVFTDTEWGRVGGIAYIYDQGNPFALSTDDYALSDFTALHEIGHVLNGQHEYEGTGIAHPVVNPQNKWMTIMGGYIHPCKFVGPNKCTRLKRWSNPDQTYTDGTPLGIPGQADMRTHLQNVMPVVAAWRGDPWTPPPSVAFSINGQTNGSITLTANTPFTLSYSSTNAVSCNLTAYSNGALWYSIPNYHSTYNWGTLTGFGTGSYSWHVVCRNASGETASASASLTMVCDYRAGTHGQTWTAGGGYSQYAYSGGWCSIGTQLPPMCFQGTYYYYQYQLSSYCASAGSGGSCYSGDAWWWVTCQSLVDCVFNCSGECVQSSC